MTFQRRYLDKRIILINPEDYDHWYPDDGENGYFILGKPIFNDDKSVGLMFVTNQYSADRLILCHKKDGGWNHVMVYESWVK